MSRLLEDLFGFPSGSPPASTQTTVAAGVTLPYNAAVVSGSSGRSLAGATDSSATATSFAQSPLEGATSGSNGGTALVQPSSRRRRSIPLNELAAPPVSVSTAAAAATSAPVGANSRLNGAATQPNRPPPVDDLSWLDALAPVGALTPAPTPIAAGVAASTTTNDTSTISSLPAQANRAIPATSPTDDQLQVFLNSVQTERQVLVDMLTALKSSSQEELSNIKQLFCTRLAGEEQARRDAEQQLRDQLQQLRCEWRSLKLADSAAAAAAVEETGAGEAWSRLWCQLSGDMGRRCTQLTEQIDLCMAGARAEDDCRVDEPATATASTTAVIAATAPAMQWHSVMYKSRDCLASVADCLSALQSSLFRVLQTERADHHHTLSQHTSAMKEMRLTADKAAATAATQLAEVNGQLAVCRSSLDTATDRGQTLEKELSELRAQLSSQRTEHESEKRQLVLRADQLQLHVDKCRRQLVAEQNSWLQLVRRERAAVVAEAVRLSTRLKLAALQQSTTTTTAAAGGAAAVGGAPLPLLVDWQATAVLDDTHTPTIAEVRGLYKALLEEHELVKRRSDALQTRDQQLHQAMAKHENAKQQLAALRRNLAKQQLACSLKSREADEMVKTAAAVRQEGEQAVEQGRQLQLQLTHQKLQLEHREAELQHQQQQLMAKERSRLAATGDRCVGDRCAGDRCVGDRCAGDRCVGDRCVF